MANSHVTIDAKGTPRPHHIQIDIGDTVTFEAAGVDVVLCFSKAAIFGNERYEIPAETVGNLVVQRGAPQGRFSYSVSIGDLQASCDIPAGHEDGEGSVGGGPGVGEGR